MKNTVENKDVPVSRIIRFSIAVLIVMYASAFIIAPVHAETGSITLSDYYKKIYAPIDSIWGGSLSVNWSEIAFYNTGYNSITYYKYTVNTASYFTATAESGTTGFSIVSGGTGDGSFSYSKTGRYVEYFFSPDTDITGSVIVLSFNNQTIVNQVWAGMTPPIDNPGSYTAVDINHPVATRPSMIDPSTTNVDVYSTARINYNVSYPYPNSIRTIVTKQWLSSKISLHNATDYLVFYESDFTLNPVDHTTYCDGNIKLNMSLSSGRTSYKFLVGCYDTNYTPYSEYDVFPNKINFSITSNYSGTEISEVNVSQAFYANVWIDGSPTTDIISQYRLNVYTPTSTLIHTLLPVKDYYNGYYPIQLNYVSGLNSGEGYYRFDLIDFVNAVALTTSYLKVGNVTEEPPTICLVTEICGYVYDTNGSLISGATVTLTDLSTVITDDSGYYHMVLDYNGGKFYTISKTGFSSLTGLQTFYAGTRYDWILPTLEEGTPQYIDFHVTGEGITKIYKNNVFKSLVDDSHDYTDSYLIGDTIRWNATPNINQSFINVCNAEGTICYDDSEKTITVTSGMQSQFNFIFTGVQKINVYNITQVNDAINTSNEISGRIDAYNYSEHTQILTPFITAILNMIPVEIWGLWILGLVLALSLRLLGK